LKVALARPGDHPLSRAVREAGWEPVHFPVTRIVPVGAPPPQPLSAYAAVILPSPSAARALLPWLGSGPAPLLLAQGQGTLEALGGLEGIPARVRCAPVPTAEGIWDSLQADFPEGGSFLLARAERSRGYLEQVSQGTPWRVWPWITHREEPAEPLPPLPAVDAVLALSPLQAEILAPMGGALLRFGWGDRTLFGFRRFGMEPTATCEPRLESLKAMLREHLQPKVTP
jgi:uroporphyrinogen-III synthase